MPNNSAYLSDKEVLFTGWMVKAPPEHKMKRKTGLAKVITYKWHRRYFVLYKPKGGLPNEYLLEYFTDESCTRKKGTVDLDNCSEIAAFDQTLQDIKMEYVLSLKTMSRNKHRVYFMSCESEETMNEWVRNLIFACNLVARNDDDYQMNDVPACPMNVTEASSIAFSGRNYSCSSLSQTPGPRPGRSNTTSGSSSNLLGGSSNGPPLPPPPQRHHANSCDSYDGSLTHSSVTTSTSFRSGAGPYNSVYNTPPDRSVYNVPPTHEFDSALIGRGGEEHYYNMRSDFGQGHDSVYQMPPEHPPRGAPVPLTHEYINLASVNKDEEDVYKYPTPEPPPVPPPPLPKRSLRASFVRRGTNQRPNIQQQPLPQPPLPQQRNVHHQHMQAPPSQMAPQPRTAGPPPPASPGSEQHEYLNLWTTAEAPSDVGGVGGVGDMAPRNINDVPPLLPARPQRLRQQRDAGKHQSSCSNSSSSSSSSTNSSASPPGLGSGVVSEPGKWSGLAVDDGGDYVDIAGTDALQLPPLATLPAAPPPCHRSSSPPYDYASERRPSAPSPPNRVSYMSANDLIFSNEGISPSLRRSSSFTEYNELDPVRTCAVAKVAEGLQKNTN